MIDVLDDVYGPVPVRGLRRAWPSTRTSASRSRPRPSRSSAPTSRPAGRDADQILLHELAHQWVGDAVSPATWQDIWLNEGFATYAEWLWLERTGQALGGRHRPAATRASRSSTRRRATRARRAVRALPCTSAAG